MGVGMFFVGDLVGVRRWYSSARQKSYRMPWRGVVTVVVSPAGFGKTIAVSAWPAALDNTTAVWLHAVEVDSKGAKPWRRSCPK